MNTCYWWMFALLWTHREMIPGGKLFGIALVSTQKALSLVQEQVEGQRGILGALLASNSLGRLRHRHSSEKQISLVHVCPSSGILVQDEKWMSFLKFLLTGKWEDGEPAYNPSSLIMLSAEGREAGREVGGVSVVLCILAGCRCSAASLDLWNLSLRSRCQSAHCRNDEQCCFLCTKTCRRGELTMNYLLSHTQKTSEQQQQFGREGGVRRLGPCWWKILMPCSVCVSSYQVWSRVMLLQTSRQQGCRKNVCESLHVFPSGCVCGMESVFWQLSTASSAHTFCKHAGTNWKTLLIEPKQIPHA